MKKIFSLIAFLATAAGMVGCADNDEIMNLEQPDTVQGLVEVCAYTSAETRTTLDSEYNVLWSANDKIRIGDKEFLLRSGAGTTSGTFVGPNLADGVYPAYYPSNYNGMLWTEQRYAGPDNISGAPMIASATVSKGQISSMKFNNLGGILRYTVKGNKRIKSINVKGGGIDVTLDCGNGVALTAEGTVFNIALPAGTYSNAQLTFLATDGMMVIKKATTLEVTRNKVSLATFDLLFEPSSDSPTGTADIIYGREAVVVDLGGDIGKVAIATKNEQVMGTDLFDYSTIVNNPLFKLDGWYVPSAHEMELFGKLFMANSKWDTYCGENGRVWVVNGYPLFLPAAGFGPDSEEAYNAYYNKVGVYASKDSNGVQQIYRLAFDQNSVNFGYNMTTENGFRYSVRLFHRLEGGQPLPAIDYNSPEGTHGMFYGQEAVVVNIGGKLKAMATKNLGAAYPWGFGGYYTAADAETAASEIGDGWRLPTATELKALTEAYSISVDNGKSVWATLNGVPGWQINFDNGNTLFFPRAGYSVSGGDIKYQGVEAMYCAKSEDGDHGKYMNFYQRAISMMTTESPNSHYGSVRLIRDLELCAADPEGTIGKIDGRMGIVADLGGTYGKVAITLMNEGASSDTDAGNYYIWSDAKKLQTNGWYLPTSAEWLAFRRNYLDNLDLGTTETGATWTIGNNTLYMPYVGRRNDVGENVMRGTFQCWTSSYYLDKGTILPDLTKPYFFKINPSLQTKEYTVSIEMENTAYLPESLSGKLNVRLFHKL